MFDFEQEYAVLHTMPLGVCIFDKDYVVRFWNRCLESWTKIRATDIMGKPLGDFFPHLMQPKFMGRIDALFQGGPPAIFSARLHGSMIPSTLPNGESRLQHTVARILERNDDSPCILVTMQDVTEAHIRLRDYAQMHKLAQEEIAMRKEVEASLRESEQRYRIFFESGDAIKLILHPKTGAIIEANAVAETFYGYSGQHLRNLTIYDLLADAQDVAGCESTAQALMQGGYFSLRHCKASGELRHVDMRTCQMQYNGETLVVSSIQDMTDLRRLEQIKADVEKIVHHDLKSPLTGLITIPELLMEDENTTAGQRKLLMLVAASGRRMLNLINSSLELYKIENGTYVFYPERCDPGQIVADTVDVLIVSMGLEPTAVRVRTLPADAANTELETDSSLLEVICMNIFRNALEACDAGHSVDITLVDSGHDVEIRVCNNRPVPERIKNHFFEKYVTAEKIGGTGLGTYSAAQMTRALGGIISMHSTSETGTCVTVRLPRHYSGQP